MDRLKEAIDLSKRFQSLLKELDQELERRQEVNRFIPDATSKDAEMKLDRLLEVMMEQLRSVSEVVGTVTSHARRESIRQSLGKFMVDNGAG